LWYVAAGRAKIRPQPLEAVKPGDVRVRTLFSAVSRGTERLVSSGRVPSSEFERMRAPFMAGTFPFPVKYGYACVGRAETGKLAGEIVFALHPHQTLFDVPEASAIAVPNGVSPQRAVLAANMETALNAVWDSAPVPGDRIGVVGAGVVGALTAWLCGSLAGAEVTLVDIDPARAALAKTLGVGFAAPDRAPTDCDVVFHASASAPGLATALNMAGDEATVVELSWYGTDSIQAPLGGAFHSRRLKLVSSQVGQIAPSHRPRWTYRRRMEKALSLLADPQLDALLAPAIDFHDLPAQLSAVLAASGGAPCPVIRYPS
jgi:hypothetical protein